MHSQSEFTTFLEQRVYEYRGILEGMFGPCDRRFVFGTIRKSNDGDDSPHTNFPNGFNFNGDCAVDIHITEYPWQHWCLDQGTWQVAHESVHLLDPGVLGSSNFLEEGIATWFQDDPKYHIDEVTKYIQKGKNSHSPDYLLARDLVCCCTPQLTSAVKEIRSWDIRIPDITAQVLAPFLPKVDRATIDQLCTRFPI